MRRSVAAAVLEADAQAGAAKLGIVARGKHYIAALARWTRSGFPVRTPEEAAECEAICRTCPSGYFDAEAYGGSGGCRKCGCATSAERIAVASKTVMDTEKCPRGHW